MAGEIEGRPVEGEEPNVLAATEKQRTALYHWGVPKERADDPGLTRSEASKWLGELIAGKRWGGECASRAEEERTSRGVDREAVATGPELSERDRGGGAAQATELSATEPQSLEIEITSPTAIPYSSVRVRAGASRKPAEALSALADRLTEALIEIVRREVERLENALGPSDRLGEIKRETGSARGPAERR